jgi:TolA-binding protein
LIDKTPLDRQQLKEVLHRNDLSERLLQARDWAQSHVEALFIGVLVTAAVAFGAHFFLQGQREKALEASKLLGEAQRLFQQAQFADTAEARQLGFNQAYAKYQALLGAYEGMPQAMAARLGLANALLAQGKAAEAERDYAALDSRDPKDPIAALAALGRARSLEAQGKAAEAARAYEQAAQAYPDSPAAAEAAKALGASKS